MRFGSGGGVPAGRGLPHCRLHRCMLDQFVVQSFISVEQLEQRNWVMLAEVNRRLQFSRAPLGHTVGHFSAEHKGEEPYSTEPVYCRWREQKRSSESPSCSRSTLRLCWKTSSESRDKLQRLRCSSGFSEQKADLVPAPGVWGQHKNDELLSLGLCLSWS